MNYSLMLSEITTLVCILGLALTPILFSALRRRQNRRSASLQTQL